MLSGVRSFALGPSLAAADDWFCLTLGVVGGGTDGPAFVFSFSSSACFFLVSL